MNSEGDQFVSRPDNFYIEILLGFAQPLQQNIGMLSLNWPRSFQPKPFEIIECDKQLIKFYCTQFLHLM
jgi:hypothetical protein